MEMPFEFQELRSAGEGSGQADTVHRRLGARAGKTNPLITGDRPAKEPGELGMQFILVRASGATIEHGSDGLAHARVAVP